MTDPVYQETDTSPERILQLHTRLIVEIDWASGCLLALCADQIHALNPEELLRLALQLEEIINAAVALVHTPIRHHSQQTRALQSKLIHELTENLCYQLYAVIDRINEEQEIAEDGLGEAFSVPLRKFADLWGSCWASNFQHLNAYPTV